MRFGVLVLAVILLGGFIFWKDITGLMVKSEQTTKKEKPGKEDKKKAVEPSSNISTVNKWDLPGVLKEVSGIAWVDGDRFACIQDEEGTIYIYNRTEGKIEKEIPFAAPGDYEGIALNGNMAYVVRADGRIYEVDMTKKGQLAKEYKTPLTAEHNVEGLCYDEANNRLLLAIKDEEPGNKDYKGIYSFSLATKSMNAEPVYKIDLDNELLKAAEKKKKAVMPSSLAIHPVTKEMYITDGPKSKLLIMDNTGIIKSFLDLGKSFEQPEGVTFSPEGEVFISNEGTKSPGNIIQVQVN